MTQKEFRRMALAFPDAEEREHMDHPDFRVDGRIFATMGYPDVRWGMVKLFPDQQAAFVAADPEAFVPAKGAWGRQGSTCVLLKAANKTAVQEALHAAWRNAAVKAALRHLEEAEPALKRTPAAKPAAKRTAARRRTRVSNAIPT